MKYASCLLLVLLFAACKQEPHLKHKLAFKKVSDGCPSGTWNYKLISNTNGERYQFNQCLAANYNGTYTLTRRADTIDVQFPVDTTQLEKALFSLELDVDAWPKYSHIYLGGQLMKLGAK